MTWFRLLHLSLVLVLGVPIAQAQGPNSVCGNFPCGNRNVSLCHAPPGNPSKPQNICISSKAAAKHWANHEEDSCGPCDADPFPQLIEEMEAACDTDKTVAVLQEAAMERGLSIDADLLVMVAGGVAARDVIAPITGAHLIPATQLSEGIDGQYLYLSKETLTGTLEGPKLLPAGFYTLRAILDNPSIGTHDGIVQLIDSQGAVEAALRGEFEITSLETPSPDAPRATVGVMIEPRVDDDDIVIEILRWGWLAAPEIVIHTHIELPAVVD